MKHLKYTKPILVAILMLGTLLCIAILDSHARPSKWSRGTQMDAVSVLRDSTIDSLLIHPDDWAVIAKLTAGGIIRGGTVDSNSLTTAWRNLLRSGFVQHADTADVTIVSVGTADSSAVVGQLPYKFRLDGFGSPYTLFWPSQRWGLRIDTMGGLGSAKMIVRDLTGDESYFLDSSATRTLISAMTPSVVIDSSRVTGQMPYGIKLQLSNASEAGRINFDTTSGFIKFASFANTRFLYPDSTWIGNRVAAAVSVSPFYWTQRQAHIVTRPGATDLYTDGTGTPQVAGTPSNNDQTSNAFISYLSGATSGDTAGVYSIDRSITRGTWNPVLVVTIRVPTGTPANVRYWIGLMNNNIGLSSTPDGHIAAFRYATDVDGSAFWRAVSCDGTWSGGSLVTSTGITVSGATAYTFRIAFSSNGTVATYYINDVAVAQHGSKLPSVTEYLGFAATVTTLTASGKVISVSRISLVQD